MGKIIVSTNVSLDAVSQDPDGQEDFKHGGWFGQSGGKDLEAWFRVAAAEAMDAEALLLGRRSDEWFAARWIPRTGEWADRLNSMPKYIVSGTLPEPRWSNATILTGELVDEVTRLKQQLNGEILVYGSIRLVRALLDHDLVDEVRLTVFPIILGTGERIFGETGDKKPMRLIETRTIGDGLVYVAYEMTRAVA